MEPCSKRPLINRFKLDACADSEMLLVATLEYGARQALPFARQTRNTFNYAHMIEAWLQAPFSRLAAPNIRLV